MGPTCGVHGSVVGLQSAAVSPEYVGWVQVWPRSNEKYTPASPTPRLNVPSGNEHAACCVDAAREQGCMSTRSLAPAASTSGRIALTASAGSFCEFWMWVLAGLPTLTRASDAGAECAAGRPSAASARPAAMTSNRRTVRTMDSSPHGPGPGKRSGHHMKARAAHTCPPPSLDLHHGRGQTWARARRSGLLLRGGLLRGGLLRGGLRRGGLLGRGLPRGGLLGALRRTLGALLGEHLGRAQQRDRVDRVVLAQGRVGLLVGHVRTEAALLDHHRLSGLRVLTQLLQRRRGRPAAPGLGLRVD